MNKLKAIIFNQEVSFLVLIILVFLALRLPMVHLPYHQDEWKNVASSASFAKAGAFFSHPPLMQIAFVAGYKLLGPDNFRFYPLFFSLATLVLLYLVIKERIGLSAARWAVFLFVITFYSIWGSLMADFDGSLLPLLFLLAIYSYQKQGRWWFVCGLTLLIGLLVKLSFIIVVGTLFVDYWWENWHSFNLKKFLISIASLASLGLIYVALLYLIQAIYPPFSISFMLGHANQYGAKLGRNWSQILIQVVKAVYYLSPLLLTPLLFINKTVFRQIRVFFIYLIAGLVFYLGVFDFSRGVLDKYLMFTIIPLVAIGGTVFAGIFKEKTKLFLYGGAGVIISLGLLATNWFNPAVIALYPKTEWFSKVFHGHWNILTPLTGGSGPMGFYVSFLFIASTFILALVLAVFGLLKKDWRSGILVMILILGVSYNLIFTEELVFGAINGSSATVLKLATDFIANTTSIKKAMSYNDIGNRELSGLGKYEGRFYATPDFEAGHAKKFADFAGQYLVVDIPHLYEDGFYGQFFAKCQTLFETSSGQIVGRVYNCPK